MTREQMINTLTLLGWEPVHVPGIYPAVRKVGTDLVATGWKRTDGVVCSSITHGYNGVKATGRDDMDTEHMSLLLQEVMK